MILQTKLKNLISGEVLMSSLKILELSFLKMKFLSIFLISALVSKKATKTLKLSETFLNIQTGTYTTIQITNLDLTEQNSKMNFIIT